MQPTQPVHSPVPNHMHPMPAQHHHQNSAAEYTHSSTQVPSGFEFKPHPDLGMDMFSPAQDGDFDVLDHDFSMHDVPDPVLYSDFLMDQLDRPSHVPGQDSFGS